jgi:hypothetical protein
MSGVFLRRGERLVPMRETGYESEAVLQELLGHHPEVLAGDDPADGPATWLLVKREAHVALGDEELLRGMLDHLFLDADGVPTLVEVKRSSDTRIRREVVGQLLDYAANAAVRWSAETLRDWFEERCAQSGDDPEEVVRRTFPALGEYGDLWERVHTNLAADRLRIVFVADVIPSPLRRIVEFLNQQMVSTEVLAIEDKQYVDDLGEQQMIVPRVIGRTEVARAAKGMTSAPRWDRDSLLRRLRERCGEREAEVARRLFAWADRRGDLTEYHGRGKRDGSWSAGSTEPYLWPFVLYSYGRVEIQFQHIAKRPPFDALALRQELLARLNAIDGVEISPAAIDRRPSIPLDLLVAGDALERLTETFDWAFRRAG